jgi:hypothetical protein
LYAWIAQNRDTSSITLCCAALGVRREGYYALKKRPSHADRDLALRSALKKVKEKHPSYGVRSMIDALPETIKISYGKGYSICRDYGLLQKRSLTGLPRQIQQHKRQRTSCNVISIQIPLLFLTFPFCNWVLRCKREPFDRTFPNALQNIIRKLKNPHTAFVALLFHTFGALSIASTA